jgi:hypothetical protein
MAARRWRAVWNVSDSDNVVPGSSDRANFVGSSACRRNPNYPFPEGLFRKTAQFLPVLPPRPAGVDLDMGSTMPASPRSVADCTLAVARVLVVLAFAMLLSYERTPLATAEVAGALSETSVQAADVLTGGIPSATVAGLDALTRISTPVQRLTAHGLTPVSRRFDARPSRYAVLRI